MLTASHNAQALRLVKADVGAEDVLLESASEELEGRLHEHSNLYSLHCPRRRSPQQGQLCSCSVPGRKTPPLAGAGNCLSTQALKLEV